MTFVSRRSPWMLPRPARPDAAARPADPLLRLALSAAWRPRALALSFAAALGRLPGGGPQAGLHARIGALLHASEAACRLARERGLTEVEALVEARLAGEPLPTCASWAEVAVAEATYGRALEQAFGELDRSADAGLRALAKEGAAGAPSQDSVLAALAEDANNRECLEILVDRWLPDAVRVFGRPDGPAEPALLESRIKANASAGSVAIFLSETERRLGALRLWLPDAARMGVIGPPGWKPRRGPDE